MKVSIPPLTRASFATFAILSLLVATLRYLAYEQLLQEYTQSAPTVGEDGQPVTQIEPRFSDMFVPYLTLVPSMSIVFPWTVLTAAFVEHTVIGGMLAGITLIMCGRYLERVWGSRELAKFLAVQAVIPNVVVALLLVVIYAVTRNEWWIVNVVSGGSAVQAGFLVAFKQLVPEHALSLFHGSVRAHVKHMVLPMLVTYSALGVLMYRPVMAMLPWAGFLTSWVYLRFFKMMVSESLLPVSDSLTGGDESHTRGDASDTFAMAEFFYPAPVKHAVATVSNVVFDALVAVRVCTPFNPDDVDASNLRASMRTGGEVASDADRRRALALKVLEERLQN